MSDNECIFQYNYEDWETIFKTPEKSGKPIFGVLTQTQNVNTRSNNGEKTYVLNIESINPLDHSVDLYNDQYVFTTIDEDNNVVGNLNVICNSLNDRDIIHQDKIKNESKLCAVTSSVGNFVTQQGIKTGDQIRFITTNSKNRCWQLTR